MKPNDHKQIISRLERLEDKLDKLIERVHVLDKSAAVIAAKVAAIIGIATLILTKAVF